MFPPLPFRIISESKPDIRIAQAVSPEALSVCKDFRTRHLREESTHDPRHESFYSFADLNIDADKLLQFLGFIHSIPIGYAAFKPCICGCGRLQWMFFYIPVHLRKYGLALPFGRGLMKTLTETEMGAEREIEVTYAVSNKAMAHIFRYFGFKETHRTGVAKIGEILIR